MKLTVNDRAAYAYTGGKPFDPARPSVVFVHGALHDHSAWTLLARWCAHHGHNALAVDLPGHGRSAGPVLPDVQSLADWVLALLDAAGAAPGTPVAVVGHSMGSLIALECAARAPQRISRLVMVGTAYPMKVSQALLDTAASAPLKAIDMVNSFSISTLAAKPSYPGPGMWLHGANRALMRRILNGPHATGCAVNLFHHDFSVCDRYAHGLEAAALVRCPVTFVLGERDQMTSPKVTREIGAALKARTVMLPTGHTQMAEDPDGLLEALRSALA
ncbi:alpha/beta fold hydrolase [Aquabacterium sp. OR-4]|uniref:alpha/beta fold hydrolase n=1 Tax=Aquabacterium sp. OR-4 TaxID=2978127 RepID=UPI0021B2F81D|nr:alpha/beta hydrolase [Aquabacterium sp. OR-4]MDT7835402.1 alpha/beta hydrolase [Aquabacterium sp. OR-4]